MMKSIIDLLSLISSALVVLPSETRKDLLENLQSNSIILAQGVTFGSPGASPPDSFPRIQLQNRGGAQLNFAIGEGSTTCQQGSIGPAASEYWPICGTTLFFHDGREVRSLKVEPSKSYEFSWRGGLSGRWILQEVNRR